MFEKKLTQTDIVIITGLSGAGKTVALRSLEDIGFFCVDNLPITLLETFLSTLNSRFSKVGVGLDIREGACFPDVYALLTVLKDKYKVKILFFEADKEVLVRRYKETRRPHPLVFLKGQMSLEEAIREEESLLFTIRDAADKIIDTSNYSPHQLRKYITTNYGIDAAGKGLSILIISFGFKYGVPENLDLLFDVRFLPNPYFIPELKPLKGTDTEVSEFVLIQAETVEFLVHVTTLLDFLLPHYIKEGRSYLVIGLGCTGGRHRSPAITEEIFKHINRTHNIKPEIVHRDME